MPARKNPGADKLVVTHEEYGPGYRRELIEHHNTRSASKDAGFLLPFLHDKQNILDCGCGKGSITLGIASEFASARVVGCDIGEKVLQEAQIDAERGGLTNLSFEVGSIYALPFSDNSFDAVIAHAVFQHLAMPDAAIAELDRVLNHYRLASVGLAICCSRYRSTMSSVMAPLVVEKYPRPQNLRPQ